MDVATFEPETAGIEDILAEISEADLCEIGRLAVRSQVLREAVESWMDTQPHRPVAPHNPRKEDCPIWGVACEARTELWRALDGACGFERDQERDRPHFKRKHRRR
jgi:hypothetical protein